MRVVLAAGGTGGHVIPALAIAEELQGAELLFVGTGRELERKLVGQAGIRYEALPAAALTGKGVVGIFRFLVTLPQAVSSALKLYREFKPDLIFGFGGYPSFLPLFAGLLAGIPGVLHEQNVRVGLANKVASLFVKKSFGVTGARGFWRGSPSLLDNPVRKCFYEVKPYAEWGGEKPRLLVLGGSQGAMRLNEALVSLVPQLEQLDVQLVHQTGARDLERVTKLYAEKCYVPEKLSAFIDGIEEHYAQAQLVVCRAGALTVAEVSAAGRPAVYVPLPIAHGHQKLNTDRVVQRGGAIVVEEGEGFEDRLSAAIFELLQNPKELAVMAAKAQGGERQLERPAQFIARQLRELTANV